MKTYTFKISETWNVERTFSANSAEEAYDDAQTYQDTFNMDLREATYDGGNVTLINEEGN